MHWPEWVFSGIGVFALTVLFGWFKRRFDRNPLRSSPAADQITKAKEESVATTIIASGGGATQNVNIHHHNDKGDRPEPNRGYEIAEITLAIEDLWHTRSATHLYWDGDLFVLASAELHNPQAATVEFDLEVTNKGATQKAERCDDLSRYCRAMKNPVPGVIGKTYRIDALDTNLRRGYKREGWLHFRVKGIPEPVLKECKLRLIAVAESGATYAEAEPGTWKQFGQEFYIIPVSDDMKCAWN